MSLFHNSLPGLAHGASLWVVLALALVLGLRHAADPDHLAAVATLVATDGRAGPRAASRLGLAWGLGHALTLVAFGVPVVFVRPYLPAALQRAAEALVGLVIVALALRLLKRWREGRLHVHEHVHSGHLRRGHLRAHPPESGAGHGHRHPVRTARGAFSVGLLHGFGGSAGATVLVLASIASRQVAACALALLAAGAALSMTVLSAGLGLTLVRLPARLPLDRATPLLGAWSLAFGAWYGLAALRIVPASF